MKNGEPVRPKSNSDLWASCCTLNRRVCIDWYACPINIYLSEMRIIHWRKALNQAIIYSWPIRVYQIESASGKFKSTKFVLSGIYNLMLRIYELAHIVHLGWCSIWNRIERGIIIPLSVIRTVSYSLMKIVQDHILKYF